MNKAIIFHGTGETPNSFWYPWLATQLRGRGYTVEVPHYPDINQMPVADFLPQVLQNHTFDDNTILIGHSAGGPLILSLLERIDAVIPQAILVAGFSTESNHEPENPILQDHYDWPRIKQHVQDLYFINSTNDPWGCNDHQDRAMFDHIGGTLIIRADGHFGSGTHHQPYPTFELLDRLIP